MTIFSLVADSSIIPLSQRNLPASFWNSDYQHYSAASAANSNSSSSLSHLAAAGHAHAALQAHASSHAHDLYDPYGTNTLLGNDPWQNYMAAGSAYRAAAGAAAGMSAHDMYSAARLGSSQYSSLFLGSSVGRGGRKDQWAGSGAGGGHAHTAAAAAAATLGDYGASHSHYNAMTGEIEFYFFQFCAFTCMACLMSPDFLSYGTSKQ